jgi:cytidine deaminase
MTAASEMGEQLLALARSAAERAYAPYSNFRVGAALQTAEGTVITGCNVENASYGLAICAERNAVAAMVAASPGDRSVSRVAVVSPDASPCFPCGACRQVLREFGCSEVIVEEAGRMRSYRFEELLPHSFGPEDLER